LSNFKKRRRGWKRSVSVGLLKMRGDEGMGMLTPCPGTVVGRGMFKFLGLYSAKREWGTQHLKEQVATEAGETECWDEQCAKKETNPWHERKRRTKVPGPGT